MITLNELMKELKINEIDEVVASGWDITTAGGTSGEGGATFTTDTSTKKEEGGYQN
ncbi:MAG: hypothetical protein HC831_10160 [Chloroflexia bacterium]|nr:hypothetical protein [Chloroflexia bacterium]